MSPPAPTPALGERRPARALAWLAAGVGLGLAALLPLAAGWSGGRTFAWFDTQAFYAPVRWLVDDALRSGQLPLWNPYAGTGMPLLAEMIHGVLHPVSLATAWLGTTRSVDLLIGGYLACAGIGAALLALQLGASRSAALLAGLVYADSGFVLSMAANLVFLAGAGSLPFALAGLHRAAAGRRPADLALGALGTALLAFSGDAQAIMVAGGLAVVLALEAGGWRGVVRASAAGLLGLSLAAVQLLPTAVHLARSSRGSGVSAVDPLAWSLPPLRLVELVLPGLCRGEDPALDPVFAALAGSGRWPAWSSPSPFAASIFVGLPALALAGAGAAVDRRGRVLLGLGAALLWIALGPALRADALLGRLPIWSSFRFSEKLVGPATLLAAALAGRGLDAVLAGQVRTLAVAAGAAAAALAAGGVALGWTTSLAPDLAAPWAPRLSGATWQLGGALVGLGGWLLLARRIPRQAAAAAALLLAWGATLAAAPAALHPGDPAARLFAPGPALTAELPGPRLLIPYLHFSPIAPGQDRFDTVGRRDAALGALSHNVRLRLDTFDDFAAMTPRRLGAVLEFGFHFAGVARRYAATHVLLEPPRTLDEQAIYAVAVRGARVVEAPPGPAETWAIPHRPWASFAPQVVVVEELDEAVSAVGRAYASGSPAVVVESAQPLPAGPGRVLSLQREREVIRVEAEAGAEATLVIADAWWPGWQATLDGGPAAIYPADALVRAVRWPPGRHRLELRYRPPEVALGGILTLSTAALLAGWLAWRRRSGHASADVAGAERA